MSILPVFIFLFHRLSFHGVQKEPGKAEGKVTTFQLQTDTSAHSSFTRTPFHTLQATFLERNDWHMCCGEGCKHFWNPTWYVTRVRGWVSCCVFWVYLAARWRWAGFSERMLHCNKSFSKGGVGGRKDEQFLCLVDPVKGALDRGFHHSHFCKHTWEVSEISGSLILPQVTKTDAGKAFGKMACLLC